MPSDGNFGSGELKIGQSEPRIACDGHVS
jgi:hypothetical protein